jgi:hypothetical protein
MTKIRNLILMGTLMLHVCDKLLNMLSFLKVEFRGQILHFLSCFFIRRVLRYGSDQEVVNFLT